MSADAALGLAIVIAFVIIAALDSSGPVGGWWVRDKHGIHLFEAPRKRRRRRRR